MEIIYMEDGLVENGEWNVEVLRKEMEGYLEMVRDAEKEFEHLKNDVSPEFEDSVFNAVEQEPLLTAENGEKYIELILSRYCVEEDGGKKFHASYLLNMYQIEKDDSYSFEFGEEEELIYKLKEILSELI